MSVQSSQAFLRAVYDSPELARELRAATGTREIVRLGSRHGYAFTVPELMEASSTMTMAPPPAATARNAGAAATAHGAATATTARGAAMTATAARDAKTGSRSAAAGGFLHYEYRLADLPGFEGIVEQLPRLKIKPPSVDLDRFRRVFREEDLRSTDRSPADPEYRVWHEAMARARWRDPSAGPDGPRRDFHLINLDEHVDHPGYDAYFAAKRRTIDVLEGVFDTEVRFSGSLWYPPASYRLWHTNETQPGWRMYIVDVDEPFADPDDTSFFRYMDPRTEEIVTLRERPGIVRFFKVEQEPTRLFWHCIVNPTTRHRWSFGFVVPDDWMDRLSGRA